MQDAYCCVNADGGLESQSLLSASATSQAALAAVASLA